MSHDGWRDDPTTRPVPQGNPPSPYGAPHDPGSPNQPYGAPSGNGQPYEQPLPGHGWAVGSGTAAPNGHDPATQVLPPATSGPAVTQVLPSGPARAACGRPGS